MRFVFNFLLFPFLLFTCRGCTRDGNHTFTHIDSLYLAEEPGTEFCTSIDIAPFDSLTKQPVVAAFVLQPTVPLSLGFAKVAFVDKDAHVQFAFGVSKYKVLPSHKKKSICV